MTKQWRKSSDGPDWTDLRAMMVAIGAVHSARVEVSVSPNGGGSTGSVTVKALACFDLLPGSSLPEMIQCVEKWPSLRYTSLEDVAYNLLWQLDYEVGKVYKQEGLWAE